MKKEVDVDNDWAKTIKQEDIHIDDAKSGKKGYYCIGCNKEMVAVIQRKDLKRRSYFRHWAKDVKPGEVECVFSSKEYRERLAEQIIHRLKRIKVPAVYKLPPKSLEGYPMLIQEGKWIEANKVRSQLSFYEDKNGKIHWGKNPDMLDRYLLIRPDVTFFDSDNMPILLIELVITHKINDEKRLKIRRLGIDTVQVIIPKKPERQIEEVLKSSKAIKWVYNGKAANTEYVSPSSGNSSGVLDFDEDQRKLFEESIKCRSAQIGNLIRAIKRCLGSEPYRRAEQLLGKEISRVAKAARGARERLEEMEEGVEREISSETEIQFEEEEKSVREGESRLKNYRNRLETRYKTLEADFEGKKDEIKAGEGEIERNIRSAERPGGVEGELREEFRAEEDRIDREIAEVERREVDVESMRKGCSESKITNKEFRDELETKKRNFEAAIEDFGKFAREKETELDREFEDLQEQAAKRISKRDGKGDPELSTRIEDVLKTRGICGSFGQRQTAFRRTKEALEFIRSGAWKNS